MFSVIVTCALMYLTIAVLIYIYDFLIKIEFPWIIKWLNDYIKSAFRYILKMFLSVYLYQSLKIMYLIKPLSILLLGKSNSFDIEDELNSRFKVSITSRKNNSDTEFIRLCFFFNSHLANFKCFLSEAILK